MFRDFLKKKMLSTPSPGNGTVVALFCLILALVTAAPGRIDAAQRPFSVRYTANNNGDIYLIGNTSMTCNPAGVNGGSCTSAQNAIGGLTGNGLNNNNYSMIYTQSDLGIASGSSSSALLSLPSGSTVLWAGLYWGGEFGSGPSSGVGTGRDTVQIKTPASSYVTVNASQDDYVPLVGCSNSCDRYSAFADVTNLVQMGGSGTYTVAYVMGTPNNTTTANSTYAGWSLVVVLQNPSLPLRNLTVFDGFAEVGCSSPSTTTIPVAGFLTPYTGPVNTVLGVVAGEGDLGTTGDYFQLNNTLVSDSIRGSNNFFMAADTNLGSFVTSGNPSFVNIMGWDVARVSTNNILPNGATSANITLGTNGDCYYPSTVSFMTDIYKPVVAPNVFKSATDVNGGYLLPGEVLRFTISVGNTGYDTATNVVLTDNIPAWTTYVPNSLRILSGANSGTKTDGTGDDQAEYLGTGTPRVVFRLGTGANGTSGGTLTQNQFTSISFDVTVNSDIPASTAINNTATISNNGQTISSTSYSSATNPVQVVVLTPPAVTKSFSPNPVPVGGTSTMTIQLSNPAANAAAVTGVTFNDVYPTGMFNSPTPNPTISCTAGSTPGSLTGGGAGSASIGMSGATIAQNGSCTVTVNVTAAAAGNYVNSTGAVTTTNAGTSPGATATFAVGTPFIATTLNPAVIVAGSTTSSATFTLSNPAAVTLTGTAFSSTLPANVQVAAGAITNTCGGTVTAPAGGSSISLAGGTLPAAGGSSGTCSVTVPLTATASGYYAFSAGGVTSTQTPTPGAASNTVNLTVLTPVTVTKTFSPGSIAAGKDVSAVTITVTNPNGTAAAGNSAAPTASTTLTSVAFTDTYPANLVNTNLPNAAVSCTSGSSATLAGGAASGTTVGMSGGTLAPGGSCTVTVSTTSAAAGSYTNSSGAVSFTTSAGTTATAPAATASLNVSSLTPPAAITAFSPSSMPLSGTSTVIITITNSNATDITGVAFTDAYPAGLTNSANASYACYSNNVPVASPVGTVTGVAGGNSVSLSGGTIPAKVGVNNGYCTITVPVQASATGSYFNLIPQVTTANAGVANQAGATLYVLAPPQISKAFSPTAVKAGTASYSTLNITVTNPSTNTAALTGVTFTDAYPAGLINNGTPTASITCTTGSSGTLTGGAANGTTVGMSGGTILPGGNCVVSVRASSATAGNYNNVIATGVGSGTGGATVTSGNGGTGNAASDILAVGNLGIAMLFGTGAVAVGGSTSMTLTMTNGSGSNITNAAFTDTLPAGLTVNSGFTVTQCGTGTVAYNSATNTLSMTGGDVNKNGGTCTVTVNVTATATSTNTIPAGAFTGGGLTSADPASATLAVYAPPAVTKTFNPTAIATGTQSPSVLTITLSNSNGVAATGVAFTDTYPSGLINHSTTPAVTNTCGGTVTATAGGNSLTLTGGTINDGESCVVTVNVMSNTAGTYTNSTGTITTGNIGNQTTPATATLQVLQPLTVTEAFSPNPIGTNGTSTLTVTLSNPNAGTAILGAGFTDTYPTTPGAMVNAASPGGSTTCVGATVTALPGAGSFSLSGATVPANGSCTVSVNVTAPVVGGYNNNMTSVTTTNAGTSNGAAATLNVTMPAPTVAKSFSPTQIAVNGSSTMTVALTNPNGSAITGAGFTDTYPAGMVTYSTPGITTSNCGTPPTLSVTAAAGGNTLAVSGASIPAGQTCTISVNVTSASAGGYTNTITSVASSNAGTGGPASAPLLVTLAAPTASMTFNPTPLGINDKSLLTIQLNNGNATDITGVSFNDGYPSGLVNFGTPNASVSPSCGAAAVATATGGGYSLTLSGAKIPAGSSCTVTVWVTSASAGNYDNSTGPISSANAAVGSSVTGRLTVVAPTLTKKFDDAATSTIVAGQTSSVMKLVVTNGTGNPTQPSFSFTDTLPANLAIAGSPAPSSTCGGSLATGVAAGKSYITLTSGTLVSPAASCLVTATVTGSAAGTYRNYYDSNPALSTISGLAGDLTATGADATLYVDAPAVLQTTTAFNPATIVGGSSQNSTLTFTITNGSSNPGPQSNLGFTDTLPSTLATFVNGSASSSCGGSFAYGTDGTGKSYFTFSGGTMAAGVTTCTVSVGVTAAASATVQTVTNGTGQVSAVTGGMTNSVTNQSLTVIPAATLDKSFAASSINVSGTTTLTFTIANGTGNPAQSGLAFTDTLPPGLTLVDPAPAGAPGNTCGGSVVYSSDANGKRIVTLTNGALGSGTASCKIDVTVTSAAPSIYTNTASNIGGLGGGLVTKTGMSASLTVVAPSPSLSKAFGTAQMFVGDVTSLTFTIANGLGNFQQNGLAFTDTLPAGLAVSGTASNTPPQCGGTLSYDTTSTPNKINFTNGSLANGQASCTITAQVTSSAPGSYTNNSSRIGNIGGSIDASNVNATLVVIDHATLSSKTFADAVIPVGAKTRLTFTVTNGTGNPAQSGLAFTDSFPSGLVVATPPNAATTCGGGLYKPSTGNALTGGEGGFTFSGGSFAGGAAPSTCTVALDVTSGTPGPYANGASNIGSLGGGLLNGIGTPAPLLTVAADPTISTDAFNAATIGINRTSTLVFRIHNTDAAKPTVSGLGFTATLPAGVAFPAAGNATVASCGGSFSAVYAGSTLTFSGGSVGATDCTVTTTVTGTTAGGPYGVTLSGLSTGLVNQADANNKVTVAAPSVTKQFGAATIGLNGTTGVVFTITNGSGNPYQSGFGFTETLPAGLTFSNTQWSTTCNGGSASFVGNNQMTFSGGILNAGTPNSCTVTATVTGASLGSYDNLSGNVATSGGLVNNVTKQTLTIVGTTLAKSFSPGTVTAGIKSTLQFTIANDATNPPQTGLVFSDTYPTGLVVATPPNVQVVNCGGGSLYKYNTTTALAGGETAVTFSGGSFSGSGSGTCTVSVDVVSATAGGYPNTSANISVPAGSAVDASTVNAQLTVNAAATLSKTFSPNPIVSGGTSTMKFTIANGNNQPDQSGLSFTDALKNGLVVANPPNVSITASGGGSCSGNLYKTGTSNAPSAGDTSLTFTAGAMSAGTQNCFISVNVTSSTAGAYQNDVAHGNISNLGGGLLFGSGDTLNVVTSNPTLVKQFTSPIPVAGQSTLTFTINNAFVSSDYPAQSGLGFTDTLPTGVTVAAGTTSNTCNGTLTATVGTGAISLSSGTIAVHVSSCQITVPVTSATAGLVTNSYDGTAGPGKITGLSGGLTAATASSTLQVSGTTLGKSFETASAGLNQPVKLTFQITNGTGLPAQSGLGFTDTLPAGLALLGSPTTPQCGGGTVAYSVNGSGRSVVTFSGGTIASSGAGCTVDVYVTGSTAGSYTNATANMSALSTGMTFNGTAANLELMAPPTVTKSFTPATIGNGATSTLTITLRNPSSTTDITGVSFTDSFPNSPAQMTATGAANISGTGCSGTLSTVGNTSLKLVSGVIPHGVTCTITLPITAAPSATQYLNSTGPVTTTNAGTAGAASGTLTVAPTTLTKGFSPAAIYVGQTSTLTFTVTNGSGDPAQTGIGFTDTLPAGLVFATAPSITGCNAGVTSTGIDGTGKSYVALTGGGLASGSHTCTVSVGVTSTTAGSYTNGAGQMSGIAGGLLNGVTDQTLTVSLYPAPTVGKSFTPSSITVAATSQLKITLTNNSATTAITGVSITDNYPAGMKNTATPAAATSCSPGTVSATANGTSVSLAGATIPAGGSCTVTVNVTGSSATTYTNTTGQATSDNASPGAPATANLTLALPNITMLKTVQRYSDPVNGTVNPRAIPGSVLQYTILATNFGNGAADANSIVIVDVIPQHTSLVVAGTPVTFTDGGVASGLGFTWGGLASTTDDVSFSTNGTDFSYTPTAGANGADAAVRYLRINPKGPFNASDGTNNPSFSVTFKVIIN